MSKTINITLKVWRQNRGEEGRFEIYQAKDIDTDASFLEMMDVVNDKITLAGGEPIAFEHDCREGICGCCGTLVNGKKVNIPSYQISVGDEVTIKEKSRANALINESLEAVERRGVPSWLELDKTAYKSTVKAMPNREELTMPIQEQLIVELYSK